MSNSEIIEVECQIADYVSDAVLLKDLKKIMVTSWDGMLSIYDYNDKGNIFLESRIQHEYPLLSCYECLSDNERYIYVGSVQGEILQADLTINQFIPVKEVRSNLGISKICSFKGMVICGSWDGFIQVIDCRRNEIVDFLELEGCAKIFSMEINEEKLIISTTGNKLLLYSLPIEASSKGIIIESGLKYQTRDIKLNPQGDGYVSSSIDGRVAVEYFGDDSKKFAFRCHRMNLTDNQLVFPVNSICFVPNSNILYTGGSDGCVSCWNLISRKKVEQFPKFNEDSVVKLDCNGDVLCVATSDDSFKTNSSTVEESPFRPSRLYLIFL